MNEHTPGPWKAGMVVSCWFVFGDRGLTVASVSSRTAEEANARLIAAAPALLAACEAYVEWMDAPAEHGPLTGPGEEMVKLWKIGQTARSAIKLAKGEQ